MVLAHLRGLLKSGYPQGLRSMLRENLVLETLERELVTSWHAVDIQIQAAFASHFKTNRAGQVMGQLQEAIHRFRRIALLQKEEPAQLSGIFSSVDSAVRLYHALSEVGLVDKPKQAATS